MTRFLIAAAVAALAVPAVAQVAVPPPAPAPMKMRSGPMADGVMTLAEVQSMVAAHFQKKDANRDGILTQDELAMKRVGRMRHPAGAPGAMPAMPRMDATAMFNRIDANHDGMISRDEFAQGHEMRVERRVEMRGPDGQAMKMRHPGGMRGMRGGMMGGHMLAMADSNKDGRITLAEAQATATQHFAMADTNRDGRVTRDEMKAMHTRMGGMARHG
jgi:Ca2+-binding EF-hand superfamily protein